MPLLKNGEIVADPWTIISVEDGVPASLPKEPTIVPFAFLSDMELNSIDKPIGVIFPCDQDTDLLKPYLSKIELICLEFPVFKDGRAFSQARKIREQLKFTGELRATGKMLSDQYQLLIRVGFTSVAVPDTANIKSWQKAMHDFTEAFQPSVLHEKLLSGLRRRV